MIPPRFQSIFHKPETTIKLSTSTASHCGSIAAHLSLSPRSKRKLASSESWRSGRIPFAECNGKKKKKRETGLAKWNICDSSPLWIDIRGGEEKKDRNQFLLVLGIGSSAHRGQRSRVVFGLSFIPHRGRIDEIRGWTRVQLLACSTLAGNRITTGWKSAWKFACLRLKCFSFLWRDWVSFAIDGTEFIVVRRVSELENNFSSKTEPACAWFRPGIEFSNGIMWKEEKMLSRGEVIRLLFFRERIKIVALRSSNEKRLDHFWK